MQYPIDTSGLLWFTSGMRKETAVQFYGSERALSKVLGISHQAVNSWKTNVPIKQAWKLERKSGGKLAMRLRDYR